MFDFEQSLSSGPARPGSGHGMGRIRKTLRAAQSSGRLWLAGLSMAAALAIALPSFAQDLPIDVEIDLALTALEQAMSSENHSETLAQIERLRELDPTLAEGELLYFEAVASKELGDLERSEAAIDRLLINVGQQSGFYKEALALKLELPKLHEAKTEAGRLAEADRPGASKEQPQPGDAAPAIAGLWKSQYMTITIEETADGDLVLREADPNDKNAYVGDVVGEAEMRSNNEWVGRHTWGGRKSGSPKWGVDGGLYMTIKPNGELFIQYNDSVYTGGWTLVR